MAVWAVRLSIIHRRILHHLRSFSDAEEGALFWRMWSGSPDSFDYRRLIARPDWQGAGDHATTETTRKKKHTHTHTGSFWWVRMGEEWKAMKLCLLTVVMASVRMWAGSLVLTHQVSHLTLVELPLIYQHLHSSLNSLFCELTSTISNRSVSRSIVYVAGKKGKDKHKRFGTNAIFRARKTKRRLHCWKRKLWMLLFTHKTTSAWVMGLFVWPQTQFLQSIEKKICKIQWDSNEKLHQGYYWYSCRLHGENAKSTS